MIEIRRLMTSHCAREWWRHAVHVQHPNHSAGAERLLFLLLPRSAFLFWGSVQFYGFESSLLKSNSVCISYIYAYFNILVYFKALSIFFKPIYYKYYFKTHLVPPPPRHTSSVSIEVSSIYEKISYKVHRGCKRVHF